MGFYIDVRASAAAVLGVIERILHLELLNRIGSGDGDARHAERRAPGDIGAVTARVDSVQHEVVVAAACAIGADPLTSGPQLDRVHNIGVRPSRQTENLGVIAIDQRQVDDRSLIDQSSERCILGLRECGLRVNRDLFLCAAEYPLNLQPVRLGNLDPNIVQDERLKSERANRYVIATRRQEWGQEVPLASVVWVRPSRVAVLSITTAAPPNSAPLGSDRSEVGRLASASAGSRPRA